MDFCKNLKRLRKNKHISQSEMAEMLGVSQRTISHYENGTCEPNINCLGKIADILETIRKRLLFSGFNLIFYLI